MAKRQRFTKEFKLEAGRLWRARRRESLGGGRARGGGGISYFATMWN